MGSANIVLVTPETGSVMLPPIDFQPLPLDAAVYVLEGEFWVGQHTRLLIGVDTARRAAHNSAARARPLVHLRAGSPAQVNPSDHRLAQTQPAATLEGPPAELTSPTITAPLESNATSRPQRNRPADPRPPGG